jgi:hypothetical protein
MKKIYSLIILLICFIQLSDAQTDKKVIQFSGVVVNGDSLQPVPYTNISLKGSNHGTMSDYFGFFSVVAESYDTIVFSSLGFRRSQYIIPGDLKENHYSIIQMLQKDTILLRETVIFPWPTKEQFEIAFVELQVPDDDLERARKNLSQDKIISISSTMPMDASMNYKNSTQQFNTKLYNAGQIPMNNLLNPIAWAKFVQAWKNGDFKRKSTDK